MPVGWGLGALGPSSPVWVTRATVFKHLLGDRSCVPKAFKYSPPENSAQPHEARVTTASRAGCFFIQKNTQGAVAKGLACVSGWMDAQRRQIFPRSLPPWKVLSVAEADVEEGRQGREERGSENAVRREKEPEGPALGSRFEEEAPEKATLERSRRG